MTTRKHKDLEHGARRSEVVARAPEAVIDDLWAGKRIVVVDRPGDAFPEMVAHGDEITISGGGSTGESALSPNVLERSWPNRYGCRP
jgi:hypothetical protein